MTDANTAPSLCGKPVGAACLACRLEDCPAMTDVLLDSIRCVAGGADSPVVMRRWWSPCSAASSSRNNHRSRLTAVCGLSSLTLKAPVQPPWRGAFLSLR